MNVGRLTLWANRDLLDAIRHAAIDYRVSEGAMFEAGARLLLAVPPARLTRLLARYGAVRRRSGAKGTSYGIAR